MRITMRSPLSRHKVKDINIDSYMRDCLRNTKTINSDFTAFNEINIVIESKYWVIIIIYEYEAIMHLSQRQFM